MEARKFELFLCCLGNGITLCNKAVEEYGDYKTIGHISNAGNVKLYVNQDYIPVSALYRIEKLSEQMRRRFVKKLERDIHNRPSDVYYEMLEALPLSAYMDFTNQHRESGGAKAIRDLVPLYIENS